VASVLELPRLLEMRDPPSKAMVERAVARCDEAIAAVDFSAALDGAKLKRTYGIMAAAILVPLVIGAIFPRQTGLWARRMFLGSREAWPQNTYLDVADVHDGKIMVPRGEPYVLKVKARDGSTVPERINLTIRSAGKTNVLMKEYAKNDWRHEFAVIDQPLTLEMSGGDDDVGPIEVTPVDRPRITNLELASQHPREATPRTHHFSGSEGEMNFLAKTRLKLTVTSNVPLNELRMKSATERPGAADVHRLDATHYAIEWTQEAAARFELELVAEDSGLVSLPAPVAIGLKVDQAPRVTMAYSGVHPRITPMARIPLTIEARDDYGMASLTLGIKDERPDPADPSKLIPRQTARDLFGTSATQPATSAPATQRTLETELALKHILDVGAMKLPLGTLITLSAEATDDCYLKPQTGKSRTVTFRLVPPEELFREILQRQQAERIKFRKQIEEAEKIRDAIRVMTEPKQAADLARRHRGFGRETQRITSALSESLVEIKLNALGSPESHLLMEQNVLAPLKAMQEDLVAPQTMAFDAIFASESGTLDAATVTAAVDRQEQIVTKMKSILKQMSQWDSFVDVLNQLDEIIKLETQVRDQSDKLRKKEVDSIFDK
jgi:hypothetical protein